MYLLLPCIQQERTSNWKNSRTGWWLLLLIAWGKDKTYGRVINQWFQAKCHSLFRKTSSLRLELTWIWIWRRRWGTRKLGVGARGKPKGLEIKWEDLQILLQHPPKSIHHWQLGRRQPTCSGACLHCLPEGVFHPHHHAGCLTCQYGVLLNLTSC